MLTTPDYGFDGVERILEPTLGSGAYLSWEVGSWCKKAWLFAWEQDVAFVQVQAGIWRWERSMTTGIRAAHDGGLGRT